MFKNKKISKFLLLGLSCVTLLAACGSGEESASNNLVSDINTESDNVVSPSNGVIDARPKNSTDNNSDNNSDSKDDDSMASDFEIINADNVDLYIDQVTESTAEEAQEYLMSLKVGWNLGNTFDAYDDTNMIMGAGLGLECQWCGALTTKELIDYVKAQGFNTIRIPVSWHNHLENDNFKIAEKWLDRVQEVVDYAYDNDMYVILNIHHDIDERYYYPDSAHLESSSKYVQCIWSQLAIRFKDYDEKLIFEPVNEARLVGTNYEWYINEDSQECKDSIETINELNQLFVNIIRASGGNNVNRYLLIPGYDTSLDGVMNENFKIPEDIASNKLIVTVHAYTPYNFALQEGGVSSFTDTEKAAIDDLMFKLNDKFVSKSIPVLIGEFGARNKDNTEDRVAFTSYYVKKAYENGMVCLWWDNNLKEGSGEALGLIERYALTNPFPEIIDAMMNVASGQ